MAMASINTRSTKGVKNNMNNSKKLPKSLILFSMTVTLVLINTNEVRADESNFTSNIIGQDRSYGGLTYQKTNVRYSQEWSGYTPVSYTVTTGKAGASISVNQSKTFGTSISGDVKGINIGAHASISSGVGYTLNVPPRKSAYVGFRVLYQVESGTRIARFYDGGEFSRNSYTVKRPIRGEYRLIYR